MWNIHKTEWPFHLFFKKPSQILFVILKTFWYLGYFYIIFKIWFNVIFYILHKWVEIFGIRHRYIFKNIANVSFHQWSNYIAIIVLEQTVKMFQNLHRSSMNRGVFYSRSISLWLFFIFVQGSNILRPKKTGAGTWDRTAEGWSQRKKLWHPSLLQRWSRPVFGHHKE